LNRPGNQAVARLGLNAVYPPSEDFHVGDLWAVLVERDGRERDDIQKAVLGKAVRLAHMNIVELMARQSLRYSDTKLASDKSVDFQQDDGFAPNDGAARMSVVNFPGLVINTKRKLDLNSTTFSANATIEDEVYETIRIKSAVTYGVNAVDAMIGLNSFCKEKPLFCADAFARSVLASAVTDEALLTEERQGRLEYKHQVELRLVSRVYLTREIEQRRYLLRGGRLVVQPGADRTLSGGVDLSSSLDTSITGAARRPVAFGYRSINRRLDLSTPRMVQATERPLK
jgi:hypothetical protein